MITLKQWTNGSPSSNWTKTEELSNSQLHVKHGHSTQHKHDQVGHKERTYEEISNTLMIRTSQANNQTKDFYLYYIII